MCSLCGVLSSEHWAEDGGRRGRVFRARLLSQVLGAYGLDLGAWGQGYLLRDRKGRSVVVETLPSVWAEAEKLAGRRLDPLDTELLASLAA